MNCNICQVQLHRLSGWSRSTNSNNSGYTSCQGCNNKYCHSCTKANNIDTYTKALCCNFKQNPSVIHWCTQCQAPPIIKKLSNQITPKCSRCSLQHDTTCQTYNCCSCSTNLCHQCYYRNRKEYNQQMIDQKLSHLVDKVICGSCITNKRNLFLHNQINCSGCHQQVKMKGDVISLNDFQEISQCYTCEKWYCWSCSEKALHTTKKAITQSDQTQPNQPQYKRIRICSDCKLKGKLKTPKPYTCSNCSIKFGKISLKLTKRTDLECSCELCNSCFRDHLIEKASECSQCLLSSERIVQICPAKGQILTECNHGSPLCQECYYNYKQSNGICTDCKMNKICNKSYSIQLETSQLPTEQKLFLCCQCFKASPYRNYFYAMGDKLFDNYSKIIHSKNFKTLQKSLLESFIDQYFPNWKICYLCNFTSKNTQQCDYCNQIVCDKHFNKNVCYKCLLRFKIVNRIIFHWYFKPGGLFYLKGLRELEILLDERGIQ